jgi:hypothetical protein
MTGFCVQGDRVLVIEGDLKNLNGRVTRVAEDGKVDVMPQLEGLTQVLTFEPSQLEKFFEVRPVVHSVLSFCLSIGFLFLGNAGKVHAQCRTLDSPLIRQQGSTRLSACHSAT